MGGSRNHQAIRNARDQARRWAGSQYGVITGAQLRICGLPTHVIERDLQRGDLQRLLPKVYAIAGTPGTWNQLLWAAHLWVTSRGGVFSHATAARLWRLPGIESESIHVTLAKGHASPADWLCIHATSVLPPHQKTRIGSFPVTTIDRTLLDVAGALDEEALETALDAALLRNPRLLRRLWTVLEEVGGRGRQGSASLRHLLDVRGDAGPAASPLETRAARFLRKYRFPPAQRQFVVSHEGRFLARVDFAYPDRRLALEADSVRWHAARNRWESDRERLNAMSQVGWQTFHLLASRLKNDQDRLAAELWAVYRSRSARLFED